VRLHRGTVVAAAGGGGVSLAAGREAAVVEAIAPLLMACSGIAWEAGRG
jgi:hypothetical protein